MSLGSIDSGRRARVHEHSLTQNDHSRNIMSILVQGEFSIKGEHTVTESTIDLLEGKKGANFLLLSLQDTIIEAGFRYASSDLD